MVDVQLFTSVCPLPIRLIAMVVVNTSKLPPLTEACRVCILLWDVAHEQSCASSR